MTSTNFNELYGLNDFPGLVQERLERLNGNNSRRNSLDAALEVETHFGHYGVHRRNERDIVRFSTDNYRESSSNVLLLSIPIRSPWYSIRRKREIIVALKYRPHEGGIDIEYEQSVSGIGLEKYKLVQETLGARPHELLAAHLIARVAPVLDMYPDMNVRFLREGVSQRIVTERFAKKNEGGGYRLNPKKERVKQIFGSESDWLWRHADD